MTNENKKSIQFTTLKTLWLFKNNDTGSVSVESICSDAGLSINNVATEQLKALRKINSTAPIFNFDISSDEEDSFIDYLETNKIPTGCDSSHVYRRYVADKTSVIVNEEPLLEIFEEDVPLSVENANEIFVDVVESAQCKLAANTIEEPKVEPIDLDIIAANGKAKLLNELSELGVFDDGTMDFLKENPVAHKDTTSEELVEDELIEEETIEEEEAPSITRKPEMVFEMNEKTDFNETTEEILGEASDSKVYLDGYRHSSDTSITSTDDELEDIFANLDLNNAVVKKVKNPRLLVDKKPKAVTQIFLPGSAYSADMSALNLVEKDNIRNSIRSRNGSYEAIYRACYSHIDSAKPPKAGFNEWLKYTAFSDYQPLLFGLYASTYRDGANVSAKCPHCSHENNVTFNPEQLMHVKNQEVFDRATKALDNVKTFGDLGDYSILTKVKKDFLPKSKALVEIQMPSLHKHLEAVKSSTINPVVLRYTLFLKSYSILDKKTTLATGSPVWIKLEKTEDIVADLISLPDADLSKIEALVEDFAQDYLVKFKLPSYTCGKCTKRSSEIELDLEQMLFLALLQPGA